MLVLAETDDFVATTLRELEGVVHACDWRRSVWRQAGELRSSPAILTGREEPGRPRLQLDEYDAFLAVKRLGTCSSST